MIHYLIASQSTRSPSLFVQKAKFLWRAIHRFLERVNLRVCRIIRRQCERRKERAALKLGSILAQLEKVVRRVDHSVDVDL
eukprot:m.199654 g.199654  ORF g.199654 m.199654 type:complete len:81 (+) comp15320_c0_seq1:110-352(+)